MEHEARPTKWTLHGLLPTSDKAGLEEAFSNLEAALVEFERTKDLLTDQISAPEFNLILEKLEFLTLQKSRLEAYAELSFAADTQDPAGLNLRDRVDQVLTDSANRTLFFEMWFKELSQETIQKLIDYSGELHYYIESITRFNPYLLAEAEERIINLKDVNGIDAVVSLYEMITNQFRFRLQVDGRRKTLTLRPDPR